VQLPDDPFAMQVNEPPIGGFPAAGPHGLRPFHEIRDPGAMADHIAQLCAMAAVPPPVAPRGQRGRQGRC